MKIGILGNGQLGMMLALAAYPMGHRVRFFSPAKGDSTEGLGELVLADYNNLEALKEFAEGLDVVTYEFENVDLDALATLAESVPVYPPLEALAVSRDRLDEKNFLLEMGATLPKFRSVNSLSDLESAVRDLGSPAVLKTRRFGYDGKGQFRIRNERECKDAWAIMEKSEGGCVLESFVTFDREVSLIGVRSRSGDNEFYPLVENRHKDGILAQTTAPAPNIDSSLQEQAEQIAQRLFSQLKYVGVLTIEFFQVGDQLLVNEIAPRVHNSGHWTIEGAVTSQFANHVRAVCGMPLGSTRLKGQSTMFNLIGSMPDSKQIWQHAESFVHDYGKTPKTGRKLGHVTVITDEPKGDEVASHVLSCIEKA